MSAIGLDVKPDTNTTRAITRINSLTKTLSHLSAIGPHVIIALEDLNSLEIISSFTLEKEITPAVGPRVTNDLKLKKH
jgi:hypothetical protein